MFSVKRGKMREKVLREKVFRIYEISRILKSPFFERVTFCKFFLEETFSVKFFRNKKCYS